MKLPLGEVKVDGRINNKTSGRKQKLSARDARKIVKTLHNLRKDVGNFSSTDVQTDAGISEKDVSNRTVRRYLRHAGYRYTQCRRKGQYQR